MKQDSPEDIWEKREMNKIGLDTFLLQKENVLDFPIDNLIKSLKIQLHKAKSEYHKLTKLERSSRKEVMELKKNENVKETNLQPVIMNYFQEIIYIEDELFVLYETKIIYAFKFLEINIKQLLSAAYEDSSIARQFKWESICQFLKSKKISIKDFNDYENIEQLRNVNNSLKHSDKEIDQRMQQIQEFKNKETFNYIDLESFYIRIKKSPAIFLNSLVHFIFNDLYIFKHERIWELAKSFALRMDKKDALEFSEELLKFYQ
ncbi:MAG TPA: hypothetical protein VFT78_00545 [Hanamia sp.]|nr:hypothetical protein [Hanamia sp.]